MIAKLVQLPAQDRTDDTGHTFYAVFSLAKDERMSMWDASNIDPSNICSSSGSCCSLKNSTRSSKIRARFEQPLLAFHMKIIAISIQALKNSYTSHEHPRTCLLNTIKLSENPSILVGFSQNSCVPWNNMKQRPVRMSASASPSNHECFSIFLMTAGRNNRRPSGKPT